MSALLERAASIWADRVAEDRHLWRLGLPGRALAGVFVLQVGMVIALVGRAGEGFDGPVTGWFAVLALTAAFVALGAAVSWMLHLARPPFDARLRPPGTAVLAVPRVLDRAVLHALAGAATDVAVRRAVAVTGGGQDVRRATLWATRGATDWRDLDDVRIRLRAAHRVFLTARARRLPRLALFPYLLLVVPASAVAALPLL